MMSDSSLIRALQRGAPGHGEMLPHRLARPVDVELEQRVGTLPCHLQPGLRVFPPPRRFEITRP
jgi:hypothetical protein